MSLLDKLERKLGSYTISNITLYLVFGQSLFFVLGMANREYLLSALLVPAWVMEGQVWRLVTFIFMPPTMNPLFLLFALYMFYLMGTALEGYWGTFRYNLFLLVGYLATVAAAFIIPNGVASNAFLGGSVFLAFAFLYPDFVIYLFFILPVKIKWLALVTWILYGYSMITGDWMTRVLIIASVANFLLFFWREIIERIRSGQRRMQRQTSRYVDESEPFHRCAACGITDKSHPKMEFRYCPDCKGNPGYCMDHIRNHQHR